MEEDVDYDPAQGKKTIKNKVTPVLLGVRSTRRARRYSSDKEQKKMPSNIPKNQYQIMMVKQSYQSQTTRIIIQIPFVFFEKKQFLLQTITRVQAIPLSIKIAKQQDVITITASLPQDVILPQKKQKLVSISDKVSWVSTTKIHSQSTRSYRRSISNGAIIDITKLIIVDLNSDLFIIMSLKGQAQVNNNYLGLVNQGNTCYMNSYLQMLYHLPEFRLDFRTQNIQQFIDIHLPIAQTLSNSLDDYISQQVLEGDNCYRTQFYGFQKARKGVKLSRIPPIFMIQLKRFQYNYYTDANQKILEECRYPQVMDFGPWTESKNENIYDLYAVLVHEGSFASSGHYYVYIKIKGTWIKFNDETVWTVQKERAMNYNYGGNSNVLQFDAYEMKTIMKKVLYNSTAYMLVYVNKQLQPTLFQEIPQEFPQWIFQHNNNKKQMDQQKKIKKQSICNIQTLSWDQNLINTSVNGLGLSFRDLEEDFKYIQHVSKSLKTDQWLTMICPAFQTAYLYYIMQGKQVLMNLKSKNNGSVKDIFAQIPQPLIVYAPIDADKNQFVVVIKCFDNKREENPVYFHSLQKINKLSKLSELYAVLHAKFYQQGAKYIYFLQQKKLGILQIKRNDIQTMIPTCSPAKNQLLIVIVEKIQQGQQNSLAYQYYINQMESVQVILKDENIKDQEYSININKNSKIEQLRSLLFEQKLSQKDNQQSAQNLVLKYKTKKNTKILVEASNQMMIKDCIKAQKVIYFSKSILKIQQRLTQLLLNFYCRSTQNPKLSQLIKLVVEKQGKNKLFQFIINSSAVQSIIPRRQGYNYRMFLLAKDKNYINDIVDQNAYVLSKGELLTVLARQKYTSLVVQQYEIYQNQKQLANVFVHHTSKTGEKIGSPFWIKVPWDKPLSKLKYQIIQSIQKDVIQFEGKTYYINPAKLRVLAYIKEWNKAEQLPQPQQLMDAQLKEGDKPLIQTLSTRFDYPRLIRIGIVHNYISKAIQALRLNIE